MLRSTAQTYNVSFQLADPAEVAAAVQGDSVELAFRGSTSHTAVAPNVADEDSGQTRGSAGEETPSESHAGELGLEREALAFIAGYVASSCQNFDSSLGLPTRLAPHNSSVPSSWIRMLSRGGLMVPSERWMSTVDAFDSLFCVIMGRDVDSQPGIVRRLMGLLMEKEPALDQRIARKLVSTRLYIRLRWLNQSRAEAASLRRGQKQIRQHICGTK